MDRDRYDTPVAVANQMAAAIHISQPRALIDSACGKGQLLEAGARLYPSAKIIGIEKDGRLVRGLRTRRPDWKLIHGDALETETWRSRHAPLNAVTADVALLNPPFSVVGRERSVFRVTKDDAFECGVAMAHVLTTLFEANPIEAISVVPESLLHSDLDLKARKYLSKSYEMTLVRQLPNTIFKGARANAAIVRLVSGSKAGEKRSSQIANRVNRPKVRIVRGGLPVFQACNSARGLRYLHTTDFSALLSNDVRMLTRRVSAIERGVVSGQMILLPRVGLPRIECFGVFNTREHVQLSDCVIALTGRSGSATRSAANVLRRNWAELLELYRGTGARFVTLTRLSNWLRAKELLSEE